MSNEEFDRSRFDDDGSDDTTAYGMTDIGRQRAINQDQFLIAQLNKSMRVSSTSLPLATRSRLFGREQGQVLLVADGMGGHAAGETASSLAVDHLIDQLLNRVSWFFQVDHDGEREFLKSMQKLLQDAHSRILREGNVNIARRGMGTTLTTAHIVWPRMYVVHVGDSRCYLIRDSVAEQLTTDHTLAHQLVEAGGLTPEEEADSRWSNVLWNVLGGRRDGELIAEVRRVDLQAGDTIVLCSDGLHRYLDETELAKVVSEHSDPKSICRALIGIANRAGGEDNITVVVSMPKAIETPAAESTLDSTNALDESSSYVDFDTTVE